MTHRLIIGFVSIALIVIVAIVPSSAVKVTSGPNYYYNISPNIGQGATVYIGEEHLNLQPAGLVDNDVVGYWASAAYVCTSPASKTVTITSSADYTVKAADYGIGGSISDWHKIPVAGCPGTPTLAFRAADPSLDVNVWAPDIAADVTGKSVTMGTALQFGIVTNQYAALGYGRTPIYSTSTGDGYIDLKIRNPSSALLSQLYTSTTASSTNAVRLTSINVSTQPYYWGQTRGLDADTGGSAGVPQFSWSTDASLIGQPVYPPGTYTVWAESLLNDMKTSYTGPGGATYTGKTVSAIKSITLVPDTLTISINKDTVVRGKPFSVTIIGRPATTYHLWVKGTADLAGGPNGLPPMLAPYQAGVTYIATCATAAEQRAAAIATPGSALGYTYQNAYPGLVVFDDVSHVLETGFGNMVAANVHTTTSGTRTVGFDTTSYTKPQLYTIHVEQNFSGSVKSDEVSINVEKGVVTIVAAGDQTYNRGEIAKFSGVNTESYTTYLFITGLNLNQNGAKLDNPIVSIINQDPSTFVQADVASDNTWSYDWTTTTLPLNSGTYTIYAVSQPVDRAADHIANTAYGTVTINFDTNNPKATKIGIHQNGWWYLDSDGSYAYNAIDKSFAWGNPGDKPVLGDWNGDGKMKAGIFRNGTWVLDYDGNGMWSAADKVGYFGGTGSIPVAGDWNSDNKSEIGIFQDGWWYLDYDGSNLWNTGDISFAWGNPGDAPVLGDWNGDGKSKAGIFHDGTWVLDHDGNGIWSAADKVGYFGGAGSVPIVGDWNNNNKDEIGIFQNSWWYLDYDGSNLWNTGDASFAWGTPGDKPILGDWNDDGKTKVGVFRDGTWVIDYDGNGIWSAADRVGYYGGTGSAPIVGKW